MFARGVVHLTSCGQSPKTIQALESFIQGTNGGLKTLELYRASVAPELLLELCRACPRLTQLRTPVHALIPHNVVEAIAQACPLIEGISVTTNGREDPLSPAETWARHFPRLKVLSFRNGWLQYEPTKIDAIRATAQITNATEIDVDGCHIMLDVIEALVGTPFGDRLERFCFSKGSSPTLLEPDALLAAVRGFPRLRALAIPSGWSESYGHRFYEALVVAGTARGLTHLAIRDIHATDQCVAMACRIEGLEVLEIDGIDATGDIVNCILEGVACMSLTSVSIRYCAYHKLTSLRARDLLRLVKCCRRLKSLSWFCDEEYRGGAELRPRVCDEIVRYLENRGGRVVVRPVEPRPFPFFLAPGDPREPDVLFSCRYDSATERYY